MYTEAKLSAEVHHRNRYPFLKYPFQKVGSRKSEFGSLKSEVRSLKSEVWNLKSEVRGPFSATVLEGAPIELEKTGS